MTASNPFFSFGGGLDAAIQNAYPNECKLKQDKGGGNERIGRICFTITVNEWLKATPELIKQALQFAIANTQEDELLLIPGVGTGIGGMSEEQFLSILGLVKGEESD